MKSLSLSTFLGRLIWLCVLPLVLLAIYLAVHQVQTIQAQSNEEAENQVRNVATAIDRSLQAQISALQVLAASPLADDPARLNDFYNEAKAFRENFGGHVILADLSTQMLLFTHEPFGTPLPELPRSEGFSAAPAVLKTGKPAVGDIFIGRVQKEPLVAVVVPVIRDGKTRFLLLSINETNQFQQRLRQMSIPSAWSLTLLDGKNDVLAQSATPRTQVHSGEDEPSKSFVARSAVSRWSVVLNVPRSLYRSQVVAASAPLAVAILAATLISIVGGRAAARRLTRSVAELAKAPVQGASKPAIAEIETVRQTLVDAAKARDEAEAKLRESEQRYRELYENSPDMYASVDATNYHIVQCNHTLLQVTGYTKDEVVGRSVFELYHPDSIKAAQEAFESFQTMGKVDNAELQLRPKDGSKVYVMLNASAVYDESGKIAYSRSSLRDITERKEAEEALRESEARFRRLMDHSPIGMTVVDMMKGEVIYLNDKFTQTFGYTLGDIPTLEEWWGLAYPDPQTADSVRSAWVGTTREAYENGTETRPVEREVTCKDGSVRVVEFRKTVIGQWVIHILNDITEARRQKEALRESEERLRLFIQHAPTALAMFDREMRYLAVSRRWMKDYRLDDEDIIGRSHYDIFPEIPDRWKAAHQRGLASEVVSLDEDCFERTDGSVYWLRWEVRPWYTADRGIGGIIIFTEDVTERKRAEDELRKAHDELELRVRERTAELQLTNEELKRSNADLQQFAYVASHDLQEPLRNVASCLQMLEKKYKNHIDAGADKLIHYAVEGAARMKDLISDLLEYSRVATKGKTPERINSEEVLHRTLRNLRSAIAEAGAVIINDPLPEIFADDSQLSQVFQNLIQNAVKFRKEEPPQIHVSAVKKKSEWIFSVKDNGIGIESQHLVRIFAIFQRIHKRSEYDGTGMGLAIVKKVVERHGGRVWVESEPGVGTTFYFTIPAEETRM